METADIPGLIFVGILGIIFLIVIIAFVFTLRLDRKGIKNSKKIAAGNGDGADSVYLS